MPELSDPIHTLRPSPVRRAISFIVMLLLGTLLLYLAAAYPPEAPMLRVFLLVLGGVALWTAWRGWTGATQGIVFDSRGLHSEDGTLIAGIENIVAVDRGAFAFKPSNGFVLRLQEPMARGWVPGMWWRFGRRVGIGGVISGSDAKFVADALSVELSRR